MRKMLFSGLLNGCRANLDNLLISNNRISIFGIVEYIHQFTNQQNQCPYTFADINIAEYEYMRGKIFKYIRISKNSLITGVMGLKSGISRFYLPVQNNKHQEF